MSSQFSSEGSVEEGWQEGVEFNGSLGLQALQGHALHRGSFRIPSFR
jgi:hypothetical protein